MWSRIYSDLDKVETLKQAIEGFETYLDQVHDDLLSTWKLKGKRKHQLSATLHHCLQFSTWQSLKRETPESRKITELVMTWIRCTAQ
jgi:hypothetical protein